MPFFWLVLNWKFAQYHFLGACLITSWLRTLLWSSTTCVPLIRRPTKIQVVSRRWRRTSCSWRSTCQWIICLDNLLVGSYRHSFGTFCNGSEFLQVQKHAPGKYRFLPTASSELHEKVDQVICVMWYLVVFLAWLSFASLAEWNHRVDDVMMSLGLITNHFPSFHVLSKYGVFTCFHRTRCAEATFCVPGTRPKKNAGLTSPSSPGAHSNNGEMAQM